MPEPRRPCLPMCAPESCKRVRQSVRKEQTITGQRIPIKIVSDLTEVYIKATITNMKAEVGRQAPADYNWSGADPLEGKPKEEHKFAREEWLGLPRHNRSWGAVTVVGAGAPPPWHWDAAAEKRQEGIHERFLWPAAQNCGSWFCYRVKKSEWLPTRTWVASSYDLFHDPNPISSLHPYRQQTYCNAYIETWELRSKKNRNKTIKVPPTKNWSEARQQSSAKIQNVSNGFSK